METEGRNQQGAGKKKETKIKFQAIEQKLQSVLNHQTLV